MLQLPSLLFSFLLALTYAAVFHLWKGRNLRDLLYFMLASVAGFACGQLIGGKLNLVPWLIGQVRLLEATLGAVIFLVVASWLRPRVKKR